LPRREGPERVDSGMERPVFVVQLSANSRGSNASLSSTESRQLPPISGRY